ncbi:bifunctional diaminohydroxyphosphoribosylaminopyrimidine deaminase/5-amino-6-(5-phosphoribosylamino)uracil reductase RibD [Undibacterium curvum]|uniref:Riboflavin biosynthesis protein RibD n=1 Tax=Undibacterium curvum TaxID=2762294 RepID=A0ABR7A9S4_9BURK|nr:bifunctional diaminohydroxyphosphoribosylaminopyrimidine deaminase/5-amino-6-(5-phosphoribosylamino)uracil reductase RibD [Undibacterium curvum]MBC3933640.1 bifunctional diaminohydroxyphosphoribosylaminopyrimidine deaminase/5-amino-6-(5-phosphoribosylamino)uracil reductase RibD [Undibacterium curvum]
MNQQQTDRHYLQLALALAARATIETSPNPKVGCVIVKDGQILGQGWTQPVGQAHAEVMALRDAHAQGHAVAGATAYVTLEPCSHFGRTPPCANALVDAGIARVVAAVGDANPQVAGRGLAILQQAGLQVECGQEPDIALAAREMNLGFFRRMESGKPWVRVKMAASLDGRTALPNGQSQWITSPAARLDGHQWRARADAILTGIGTVLADDPQLNVRGISTPRQPIKIIVDSHLQISPQARCLQQGVSLVVAAHDDVEKRAALEAQGVEVLLLPAAHGRVDLPALLLELGCRQINELHVEAGAVLNGALLEAKLADELLVYLAPKLLGAGAGLLRIPELTHVDQAESWQFHDVQMLAPDLRILARRNLV